MNYPELCHTLSGVGLCAVARLLRGERSTQEQERWEDAYGVCSYQYELDHGMLVKIAQLEPRDDQWQGRPNGPAMASCCAQERSQDPVGDALRAAPCCVALEGDAEVEAGCVQWGTQLDTESEDEVDLRWLRPPNMVHDTVMVAGVLSALCALSQHLAEPQPQHAMHVDQCDTTCNNRNSHSCIRSCSSPITNVAQLFRWSISSFCQLRVARQCARCPRHSCWTGHMLFPVPFAVLSPAIHRQRAHTAVPISLEFEPALSSLVRPHIC